MEYIMNINENQIFYNYIFVDPRKPGQYSYEGLNFSLLFEPFYVGKGKKDRKDRHCEPFQLSKKSYKNNKIKAIIKNGYRLKNFTIQINKNTNSMCACTFEKHLIKTIGRHDQKTGTLTNLTDGGEGLLNVSFDIKNRLSLINSGNGNPQSLHYLIHIKNMSEKEAKEYLKEKGKKSGDSKRGSVLSNHTKKLISLSLKGKSYIERFGIEKANELRKQRGIQFSGSWESRFTKEHIQVLKNNIRLHNTGRIKTQEEIDKRVKTIRERGCLSGKFNPSAITMFVTNHNTNETIDITGNYVKFLSDQGMSDKMFKEYTNKGIITLEILKEKYKNCTTIKHMLKRTEKYIGMEFIVPSL